VQPMTAAQMAQAAAAQPTAAPQHGTK